MLGYGHEAFLLLLLAGEGLDQGDGGKDAFHRGIDWLSFMWVSVVKSPMRRLTREMARKRKGMMHTASMVSSTSRRRQTTNMP
jgi:hypothetical protein